MSNTAPIVSARTAANRRNATKSTGPRTAAGKARSRANALKHGLTGAGIALPGEDAALVAAELEAAQADFAPTTRLGAKLVRRAAILSIRLDRCERYVQAAAERRIRHAVAVHDRTRAEHADRLLDAIEADPRAYRRTLLNTPEGVDRLTDALAMLIAELTAPVLAWSPAHHRRLDALFGYKVDDIPWSRPTRFSRALLGDFAAIGADEVADVPEDERGGWALLRLAEAIDAEIGALAAQRSTLDHAALAADRAAAPELAWFDPDRSAELARRYEQATARELSRVIQDFHRAEALAAPIEEPEADAEPPTAAGPAEAEVDAEAGPKSLPGSEISPMASFGKALAGPAATPAARPSDGSIGGPTAGSAPQSPPVAR